MSRLAWILAAVFVACHAAAAMQIAEQGKPKCVIVIADDATPAEQTAAKELAEYLKKSTGAAFDTNAEKDSSAEQPQILVGLSTRAKSIASDVDFDALGSEGIVIKTDEKHLVLAGGRPRGTLDAVTTFLEDKV